MIVATAGHVDHGKTTLVHALTGVDTDRLEEERRRGLTIDLGFAYTDWDGTRWGFIDVPGHHRFITNMLAGVAAIDLALIVVAADEGPMPQTREHLAILDLLGVEQAVVALTRADLVDADRLDASTASVAELLADTKLAGAPCIAVSAPEGRGIDALRTALRSAAPPPAPESGAGFRLAVDRAFSVTGSGLVVTGSAHAGSVRVDDTLRLLSGGDSVRVRGIHALERPAECGRAGERLALNITGIHRDRISRGQWLLAAELDHPVTRFDARLRLLPDVHLRSGQEVHVHHGAAHTMGRITLLDGAATAPRVHVAVREPLGVLHGDRFILRDPQARHTLCGGRVLDPVPPARGRRRPERLAVLDALEQPTVAAITAALLDLGPLGLDLEQLGWKLNREPASLADGQEGVLLDRQGGVTLRHAAAWAELRERILAALATFHAGHPQLAGMGIDQIAAVLEPRPGAVVLRAALRDAIRAGVLARTATRFHLPGHRPQLDVADARRFEQIRPHLARTPRQPPVVHDLARELAMAAEDLAALLGRVQHTGAVLRVAKNRFLLPDAVAELAAVTTRLAADSPDGSFDARAYRDAAGIGRNLTIDLLEFFDRTGLTVRRGDRRTLHAAPEEIFGPTGDSVADLAVPGSHP